MAKSKPLEYLSTLREGEDFRFPYGELRYVYWFMKGGKHFYTEIETGISWVSVVDREVVRRKKYTHAEKKLARSNEPIKEGGSNV